MRTTISLDPDVQAEIERLRRERGVGLSEAVNTLARRGMVTPKGRKPYRMRPRHLGIRIDISNIGEVLGMLDERDD